jgi:hypothetical protein
MKESPLPKPPGLRVIERIEAVAHTGWSGVLIGFAVLKEEPMFWRHAGGWPPWFREVVRFTFHPMMVVQFVVLIAFTIRVLRNRRIGVENIALLVFLWLLAITPLLVSIADNIEEFIHAA